MWQPYLGRGTCIDDIHEEVTFQSVIAAPHRGERGSG